MVPDPGEGPDAPVLYLAELYGTIKVLTRGGEVRVYYFWILRKADAERNTDLCRGADIHARVTVGLVEVPQLARPLLERAGGVRGRGSITALYTVLVDGDDHNEPIADAVRSILDGHIVLSRDLAQRHHYPPIDILQSVSRTMPDVVDVTHRQLAADVRDWMAAIRDSDDLVNVGAYVEGSNPRIDGARARQEKIRSFLCQDAGALSALPETLEALRAL